MKVFHILNPGPVSTIQDSGRFGYLRYGMAPAGAMDEVAYQLGNHILGNPPDAAAIEFALMGPEVEVLQETFIVVSGGSCDIVVKGESGFSMYTPIKLLPGDKVSIPQVKDGIRGYLNVAGGINVPLKMNSRATYLRGRIGGIDGRCLEEGDVIHAFPESSTRGKPLPSSKWPKYPPPYKVDVILGPQDHLFSKKGVETFLSEEYRISWEADRMGYRLKGPEISHRDKADIISDGIPLGAVQVPGHRQPIIMMKDRQTTGGYPKIATVASYEISKLGQARPGSSIFFNQVTLEEARDKSRQHKEWFQGLVNAIKK